MHADAKSRILLPQTKLIDFINRQKIKTDLNETSLSFETLMLMVAKDRKRIRDVRDGKKPLLGYEPEYTLSVLKYQSQQYLNHKRFDIMEDKKYRANVNPLK